MRLLDFAKELPVQSLRLIYRKVVAWCKDHVALIIGGIILLVLIVTMTATKTDYAAFAKILESTKKHYAKSESEIIQANLTDSDRIEKATEKRDIAVTKADKTRDDAAVDLTKHQKKIESETQRALKNNRQNVANELAKDIGI